MSKIYFSQYGALYSLSIQDARKMAQDALECGGHNLMAYPSSKHIKFRELSRDKTTILYGKKFIDVNFCLDWDKNDWMNFLKDN